MCERDANLASSNLKLAKLFCRLYCTFLPGMPFGIQRLSSSHPEGLILSNRVFKTIFGHLNFWIQSLDSKAVRTRAHSIVYDLI